MTDNLRDRIADVDERHYQMVASAVGWVCACGSTFHSYSYREWRLHKADAVIQELGLHYQYENGRVMYDTKPSACKGNGHWKVRIVSPHVPYED